MNKYLLGIAITISVLLVNGIYGAAPTKLYGVSLDLTKFFEIDLQQQKVVTSKNINLPSQNPYEIFGIFSYDQSQNEFSIIYNGDSSNYYGFLDLSSGQIGKYNTIPILEPIIFVEQYPSFNSTSQIGYFACGKVASSSASSEESLLNGGLLKWEISKSKIEFQSLHTSYSFEDNVIGTMGSNDNYYLLYEGYSKNEYSLMTYNLHNNSQISNGVMSDSFTGSYPKIFPVYSSSQDSLYFLESNDTIVTLFSTNPNDILSAKLVQEFTSEFTIPFLPYSLSSSDDSYLLIITKTFFNTITSFDILDQSRDVELIATIGFIVKMLLISKDWTREITLKIHFTLDLYRMINLEKFSLKPILDRFDRQSIDYQMVNAWIDVDISHQYLQHQSRITNAHVKKKTLDLKSMNLEYLELSLDGPSASGICNIIKSSKLLNTLKLNAEKVKCNNEVDLILDTLNSHASLHTIRLILVLDISKLISFLNSTSASNIGFGGIFIHTLKETPIETLKINNPKIRSFSFGSIIDVHKQRDEHCLLKLWEDTSHLKYLEFDGCDSIYKLNDYKLPNIKQIKLVNYDYFGPDESSILKRSRPHN
ncbi:hypothetical protein DLAC_05260 [Tieghemostelium lacteum]|uniref:Uncharacterized protein n=1 Tax=Tieghemostelium lacteum TaxID=361077 RepID=A0A151ZIZ7_TIELA|nr:hypothetical protein DLAC_05260 [Tieghemostelium lacteum]|eukprot:KYQ93860.1 hypothetical protein DLAC_05260 [Tieghemostelium lacteum]